MVKSKVREITLTESEGTFSFLNKINPPKEEFDFEGISALRALLSNERARLLHIIKNKNPSSIYSLAKFSGRTFKSVSDDLKLLQRFGFIDLKAERTKKRDRLRPILDADIITIHVKI
ncbi:MAG TPA: hypothetical protein VJH92_00280 [Candidatus Nanoarchaeia archaeon]|nr:hypothetical protein [Candidatus Nanoarchaeia archaeon]